jgi:hypothetical protein
MQTISLDWLQFYVDTTDFHAENHAFCKVLEYQTRHYSEVVEIYHKDEHFATLAHKPNSSILKKNTGLLKIQNKFLYDTNVSGISKFILCCIGVKYLSISRLDICCDFQTFVHNYKPINFISDFITQKNFKIGQAKYKLHGEQGAQLPYSYLRFGSNNSDCAVYLYNKSQEFRDVKIKNYIIDTWKKTDYDCNSDVWRLEISLKGNAIKFLNTDTGEIEDKQIDYIFNKDYLQNIYNCIIKKYFDFRKNDGQIRKDRMKKIQLFHNDFTTYQTIFDVKKDETGKSEKMLISRMENFNNEMRGKKFYDETKIIETIDIIVGKCNLREWYAEKFGFKKYLQFQYTPEKKIGLKINTNSLNELPEQQKYLQTNLIF